MTIPKNTIGSHVRSVFSRSTYNAYRQRARRAVAGSEARLGGVDPPGDPARDLQPRTHDPHPGSCPRAAAQNRACGAAAGSRARQTADARTSSVAATGLSAHQIEEALSVARATVSLNQLFGSDGQQTELGDLIPDPSTFEPPENELERIRRRRLIRHALGELPDRERLVVDHHYGLTGEPQTLNEIGHELGLTRERVRRLEAHALATLSRSPELLEQR